MPAGVLGPQSPMAQNAKAEQAIPGPAASIGNPMGAAPAGVEELLLALRSGNISAEMLLQFIAQLTGGGPQMPPGGAGQAGAPVESAFFG